MHDPKTRCAETLAPLIQQLGREPGSRTTVHPGRAVVERPDEVRALELTWPEEQHRAAHEALAQAGGVVQLEGETASRAGDALVLMRTPKRRLEELVEAGWLSSLASRLLAASVELGRNVLIAGPWAAAVELSSALMEGAARPALLAPAAAPQPRGWTALRDAREVATFGADRLAVWWGAGPETAQVMAASTGVIAWIDALRLDQALVRFEAGIERGVSEPQTPLCVLAGVDLVVVMTRIGGVRVRDVAEITMAAEGYRPSLLFTSGVAAAPTALVPTAAPSFVDEVALAGHHVLADELRAIGGNRKAARAEERARVLAEDRPRAETVVVPVEEPRPPRATLDRAALERTPPPAPELPRELIEALRHAPPPGWELDQVGAEELAAEDAGASSSEEAAMAATFGLAPPPRPPGIKADPASFAETLRRARERDEGGHGGSEDA